MQERLQKIIARAGIASRRHAEELILAGQVTVNGHVVKELGSKADAETDVVKVGNRVVEASAPRIYVALHKPADTVATMSDPEERTSLRDFLHGVKGRLFPVGRLDYQTAGVILLTNDGNLANRLMEAGKKGRLAQTYWLKVKGVLTEERRAEAQRESGARLRMVKPGENPWFEARVEDAARDRLRNWLFRAGHPVEKMRRMKYGPVELGRLEPGEYRVVSEEELEVLRKVGRGERVVELEAPVETREFKGGEKRREFKPNRFGAGPGRGARPFQKKFEGPGRGPRPFQKRFDGPGRGPRPFPKKFDGPRREGAAASGERPVQRMDGEKRGEFRPKKWAGPPRDWKRGGEKKDWKRSAGAHGPRPSRPKFGAGAEQGERPAKRERSGPPWMKKPGGAASGPGGRPGGRPGEFRGKPKFGTGGPSGPGGRPGGRPGGFRGKPKFGAGGPGGKRTGKPGGFRGKPKGGGRKG